MVSLTLLPQQQIIPRTHIKPIRQNIQCRHGIRCRDNRSGGDATARSKSIVPLLLDGVTLEDVPKEYDKTPYCDDDDTDAEDPGVDFLSG